MKKKINRFLGFTLVEMLVVISIIGILSVMLAGSYVNSQRSSRDAARKLNLKSIADAVNVFYSDYGIYPGEKDINDLIEEQGELVKNGVVYIKKMPKDEVTSSRSGIRYEVSDSGKSFRLYINLESSEDKGCYKNSLGEIEKELNGYRVNSGCIYVITSSNIGIMGELI